MKAIVALLFLLTTLPGLAQMRMPAFVGGIPGGAQMNAISMQRHQSRTLLYREALEELRKNPAAADVPLCPGDSARTETNKSLCIVAPGAETGAGATGRRLALLVGDKSYLPPIPSLDTPVADVERVAEVLRQKFGFTVQILRDAGKAQIVTALNALAQSSTSEESVLIFYAGHGYLMDDIGMGFWIPVDASVKTPANWLSNADIAKLLKAIPARQQILISDSCYSGTLTKEGKVKRGGAEDEILRRRSVMVLSSGCDEPVSEEGRNGHSIFAWNLIKALEAVNGVTPGIEVWQSVHGQVKKDAMQEPQYGAVVSAGHADGGEWLFRTQ